MDADYADILVTMVNSLYKYVEHCCFPQWYGG